MSKPPKPSAEDVALFRASVAGTRPLRPDDSRLPAHTTKPRRPALPLQRRRDERQVMQELADLQYDPTEHECGDELLFCRPGIQQKLFRQLRSGQLSIRRELDLHGLTVAQARPALSEFLHRCRSHQIRCVRIIHGKGYNSPGKIPIIKVQLNHWLRQRDEVLAFCSAPQVSGGTGAVHVLLRKL